MEFLFVPSLWGLPYMYIVYLLLVLSLYIRPMYSNPNKTTFTGNCIAKSFSPWSDQNCPGHPTEVGLRQIIGRRNFNKLTHPKSSGWNPKMSFSIMGDFQFFFVNFRGPHSWKEISYGKTHPKSPQICLTKLELGWLAIFSPKKVEYFW